MSLSIPINIEIIDSSAMSIATRTPKINFETGRITGYCDGLDAMAQAVKLALITPRFQKLIYDNNYGSEVASLLNNNLTNDVLEMESTRIVIEALLADDRISEVYDFAFERTQDDAILRFSVNTIFGSLQEQEVRINV